jgi:hypothetical protein
LARAAGAEAEKGLLAGGEILEIARAKTVQKSRASLDGNHVLEVVGVERAVRSGKLLGAE